MRTLQFVDARDRQLQATPGTGLTTTQALIVFARYPSPGSVKPRLAGQVGEDLATQLDAALAVHVWQVALQVQGSPLAHALLFVDPPHQVAAARDWLPGGSGYLPQPDMSRGERYAAVFRDVFRMGYTRVVVVGTDCLALTPGTLAGAFSALGDSELVLGPSASGGLYLLGMRRTHRGLFDQVTWGNDRAFDEFIGRCAQLSLSSLILPIQTSVESVEDVMAVLGASYADRLPDQLQALLRRTAKVPLLHTNGDDT